VVASGDPRRVLAEYPGAPPVVALGRLLGWEPVPLTVRDARAHALASPLPVASTSEPAAAADALPARGEPLATARGLEVKLGGRIALRDADIDVCAGDVIALLGRNGAGKTTLLRALAGLVSHSGGNVSRHAAVAYVPQNPNALLFATTVRRELEETLRLLGRSDAAAVDRWLEALHLTHVATRHPRALAGGERQRVAIAAVAVGGAPVLLLDEPTRGMDAPSRSALHDAVARHASDGGAVVLATHDVELAAQCATRTLVLGDGDVVAEGPAREVLAGTLFAPQV
jgi:energy-coupling factor transport system ATP-binding protein